MPASRRHVGLYGVNMLGKIKKSICLTCKIIITIILVVVTGMTVFQVFSRYLFKHYHYALEELSVIALIYAVGFGVPWMWLERGHISMDAIDNILTAKGKKILTFIINILALFVGGCLTWSGIKAVKVNHNFVYTTLGIDESFRYVPLVIMGVMLVVAAVIVLIEDFRGEEEK